jgi:hypothetical protein
MLKHVEVTKDFNVVYMKLHLLSFIIEIFNQNAQNKLFQYNFNIVKWYREMLRV